jgi:hypothetical protein
MRFESTSVLEGRYGVILTVKSPSKEEIRLGFSIYLSFDLFGSLLGREALKAFILKAFSVSLIGFESRTGHFFSSARRSAILNFA